MNSSPPRGLFVTESTHHAPPDPSADLRALSPKGFYGYVADRDPPLEAMLDAWERESLDEAIDRVEHEGGDPRTKITRAGVLTFSGDRLLPIVLAIRDWARRDQTVAERLRWVDNRRIALLRVGALTAGAARARLRHTPAVATASAATESRAG